MSECWSLAMLFFGIAFYFLLKDLLSVCSKEQQIRLSDQGLKLSPIAMFLGALYLSFLHAISPNHLVFIFGILLGFWFIIVIAFDIIVLFFYYRDEITDKKLFTWICCQLVICIYLYTSISWGHIKELEIFTHYIHFNLVLDDDKVRNHVTNIFIALSEKHLARPGDYFSILKSLLICGEIDYFCALSFRDLDIVSINFFIIWVLIWYAHHGVVTQNEYLLVKIIVAIFAYLVFVCSYSLYLVSLSM